MEVIFQSFASHIICLTYVATGNKLLPDPWSLLVVSTQANSVIESIPFGISTEWCHLGHRIAMYGLSYCERGNRNPCFAPTVALWVRHFAPLFDVAS